MGGSRHGGAASAHVLWAWRGMMAGVGIDGSVERATVVARTDSRRGARVAVWLVRSLWAIIVGLSGGAVVLTVTNSSILETQDVVVQLGTSLAAVGYGTV